MQIRGAMRIATSMSNTTIFRPIFGFRCMILMKSEPCCCFRTLSQGCAAIRGPEGFGRAERMGFRQGSANSAQIRGCDCFPLPDVACVADPGAVTQSVYGRDTSTGCIDDNARIYRRVFWGLRNFLPNGGGAEASAAGRSSWPNCYRRKIWTLLVHSMAKTAHAVTSRLFRTPEAILKAGYARRPDFNL